MKIFAKGVPVPKGSFQTLLNPVFRIWLMDQGIYLKNFKGAQTIGFWKANDKIKAWKKQVQNALYDLKNREGLEKLIGPIGVKIKFYMPRPMGHFNTKGELNKKGRENPYPAVKPDGDKLQRALLDILEEYCYENDSRIVRYRVDLVYAQGVQDPGADVEVFSMGVENENYN